MFENLLAGIISVKTFLQEPDRIAVSLQKTDSMTFA
jgi:hypothetical protein